MTKDMQERLYAIQTTYFEGVVEMVKQVKEDFIADMMKKYPKVDITVKVNADYRDYYINFWINDAIYSYTRNNGYPEFSTFDKDLLSITSGLPDYLPDTFTIRSSYVGS
jgi:hypothetical protein